MISYFQKKKAQENDIVKNTEILRQEKLPLRFNNGFIHALMELDP